MLPFGLRRKHKNGGDSVLTPQPSFEPPKIKDLEVGSALKVSLIPFYLNIMLLSLAKQNYCVRLPQTRHFPPPIILLIASNMSVIYLCRPWVMNFGWHRNLFANIV